MSHDQKLIQKNQHKHGNTEGCRRSSAASQLSHPPSPSFCLHLLSVKSTQDHLRRKDEHKGTLPVPTEKKCGIGESYLSKGYATLNKKNERLNVGVHKNGLIYQKCRTVYFEICAQTQLHLLLGSSPQNASGTRH